MKQLPSQWTVTYKNYEPQVKISWSYRLNCHWFFSCQVDLCQDLDNNIWYFEQTSTSVECNFIDTMLHAWIIFWFPNYQFCISASWLKFWGKCSKSILIIFCLCETGCLCVCGGLGRGNFEVVSRLTKVHKCLNQTSCFSSYYKIVERSWQLYLYRAKLTNCLFFNQAHGGS